MSKIKEAIQKEFSGELTFEQRDRIESLVLDVLKHWVFYDIIIECPELNIYACGHELTVEK